MYLKEPFLDLMKYSLFSIILIIFYCILASREIPQNLPVLSHTSAPCQFSAQLRLLPCLLGDFLLLPSRSISFLMDQRGFSALTYMKPSVLCFWAPQSCIILIYSICIHTAFPTLWYPLFREGTNGIMTWGWGDESQVIAQAKPAELWYKIDLM